MSESYREQHPLLCEEGSDEECGHAEYPHRRYRPLIYKGRARAAVKGASVIVTRWPEHWTSLVSFWWLAVSMFAISTFALYHVLIAFAAPATHTKSFLRSGVHSAENSSSHSLPSVYMHVFVNDKEEINLHDYIPHIVVFSTRYPGFQFKIVIVHKDVKTDALSLSAEENNAIALNSLWDQEQTKPEGAGHENIYIEHVPLSHYLNSSPLKKDWRRLPPQFVEFLVRAVSIWEKGGIAINPYILTPRTPNSIYLDKLHNILKSYRVTNVSESYSSKTDKKVNLHYHDKNTKKKVNNIRDIIEILENGDSNSTQDTLVEAEDTAALTIVPNKRKLLSSSLHEVKNDLIVEPNSYKNVEQPVLLTYKHAGLSTTDEEKPTVDSQHTSVNSSLVNNKLPKLSLFPLFLDFIFNDKSKFNEPKVHPTRHRNSIRFIPLNEDTTKSYAKTSEVLVDNLDKSAETNEQKNKPMIIDAKDIISEKQRLNSTAATHDTNEKYDKYHLTVDLKGNILATETPCHAFLGTVFSNVVSHSQKESLEDFIISELSLFCKGLLSSCRGIDLILL